MIYGHSFDFKHEPNLQNEFLSFPSNPYAYPENKKIEVVEATDFPYTKIFSIPTKWVRYVWTRSTLS